MISPHLRRTAMTSGAVLLFLILLGATYQGVATALERRQFPHPGQLIDIGDRQLHIHCLGQGTPVVVLEAPAVGMSAVWSSVQTALAPTTRVCSYDRAGLGWSELGSPRFNAADVPQHLHTLLERAGETAPYVTVGHGLGAAFATIYAATFPQDVAALVLVDAPAPDTGRDEGGRVRLVRASPWLARAGILRMSGMLHDRTEGMPEMAAAPMRTFLNRPDHLTRAARELDQWNEIVQLATAPLDPAIPVTRVEATGNNRVVFLTDAENAARVAAAIIGVVKAVGSRQ